MSKGMNMEPAQGGSHPRLSHISRAMAARARAWPRIPASRVGTSTCGPPSRGVEVTVGGWSVGVGWCRVEPGAGGVGVDSGAWPSEYDPPVVIGRYCFRDFVNQSFRRGIGIRRRR